MMKNLIDTHLSKHYNLHRVVNVDEEITQKQQFDLQDTSPYLFPFKKGYASFVNTNENEIHVLRYEEYINKYVGTVFEKGRMRCDFLIHDQTSSTVILNEITSSGQGKDELKKPIQKKNKKTGIKTTLFAGGKLEKAEAQLLESLRTLDEVPEIHDFFNMQLSKTCLCSYKLYTNVDLALIGNPVGTFNMGQTIIEQETGEDGAIISCPEIEKNGFEYRRISHNYSFKIN